MGWLTPSIIATLLGTLILAAVYIYLYRYDKKDFLYIWGVGWLVYALRFVFMLLLTLGIYPSFSNVLLIGNQLTALLSGLILLAGSYRFAKKLIPRFWYVVGLISVTWILTSGSISVPFFWLSFPTYAILGVIYIYTGALFLNQAVLDKVGSKVTGWSFILWGIHKIDYPFLRPVLWFAPWGYMLGAIFEMVAAIGILLVYLDNSRKELQQSQEKLRESEERYRALFEKSPYGVVILEPATAKITEFNDQACHQLGYSREEFARFRLSDIEAWETAEESKAHIQKVLKEGHDEFETRQYTKQRGILHIHVTAQLLRVGGQNVYHCIWRDISKRKQAEIALKEKEEKYRKLVNTAPYGIQLTDTEGKIIFSNPAHHKIQGYPDGELIGTYIWDLMADETNKQQARDYYKKIIEEQPDPEIYFNRDRTKDGREIEVQVNWDYLYDSQGELEGILSIISDVTNQKLLESKLQQSQKMEAVGRLAGGVAHDFNNMLGVILGYTEMALEETDSASSLNASLQAVQHAAEHSAVLTQQLLTFARKQTIDPKVINLDDTVEGMLSMLRRLIGEDIDLLWRPGKNVAPVKADPSQIDQILANLCVNARDAIAGVGKITIETDVVLFDEVYCAIHAGFLPGKFVLLAVSDNGCGMDQEVIGHLFEPFFTTKQPGKGTGLGLASVYGAVKQNNGFVNVYSEPGQGTTFKIYLPVYAEKPEKMVEKVPQLPAEQGNETILLVEDESAILEMTMMMLTRLGYTVVAAATPGEAIRLAHEYQGRVDLLMTDVVMPEMNGRELAATLLSYYPDLKCLFMSGYTANVIAHHGVLDQGVHFIQKPFSKKDLGITLRDVLAG